jgi:serine/threonine-protein kinase
MSRLRPQHWQEISPYLDHALGLPEQERIDWLVRFRGCNPELGAMVEALLYGHRVLEEEDFLEGNQLLMLGQSGLAGQTVGPYTLISEIGHGGMGTVWQAERSSGHSERQVAIKFLRIAFLGRDGEERFKREGRILGRLAHPHIAELLDAGVSASGQPYLVLEYVAGDHIDRYCDERNLDVEARLHLFLDVLSAVAHAHSNLIVHRDIKPSNVLVRNDGQVKLLDFGIAKLLEDDIEEGRGGLATIDGARPMTPEYAAPEQLSGGTVTTGTDIYALGVLLYVLLTGKHPAGTGPHSPAELIKAIVHIEPPRASDAVGQKRSNARAVAMHVTKCGIPADKLRRLLRGDLDTIIAKALKKDPEERYASVDAFADDLRRCLRNEPIRARPDPMAYRAARFMHRNRLPVTLVVFAIAVTMAGWWTRSHWTGSHRRAPKKHKL